jgi:hypothetical protein
MMLSIVPLFPGASNRQNIEREEFEREVATRFGLVPNFFRSAPDAPHVVRELWAFARSAYLDTPIPTLFKERLFVYLSRFCEVRYCITRHCGFLLGLGHAAGDPNAQAMTINQVVRLLQRPVPTEDRASAALARLEATTEPIDWPSPETSYDDDLLTSATVLFLQPARAGRAKHALRIALGGEKFELLVGFLTFVRSAHYWTLMHPELGRARPILGLGAAAGATPRGDRRLLAGSARQPAPRTGAGRACCPPYAGGRLAAARSGPGQAVSRGGARQAQGARSDQRTRNKRIRHRCGGAGVGAGRPKKTPEPGGES